MLNNLKKLFFSKIDSLIHYARLALLLLSLMFFLLLAFAVAQKLNFNFINFFCLAFYIFFFFHLFNLKNAFNPVLKLKYKIYALLINQQNFYFLLVLLFCILGDPTYFDVDFSHDIKADSFGDAFLANKFDHKLISILSALIFPLIFFYFISARHLKTRVYRLQSSFWYLSFKKNLTDEVNKSMFFFAQFERSLKKIWLNTWEIICVIFILISLIFLFFSDGNFSFFLLIVSIISSVFVFCILLLISIFFYKILMSFWVLIIIYNVFIRTDTFFYDPTRFNKSYNSSFKVLSISRSMHFTKLFLSEVKNERLKFGLLFSFGAITSFLIYNEMCEREYPTEISPKGKFKTLIHDYNTTSKVSINFIEFHSVPANRNKVFFESLAIRPGPVQDYQIREYNKFSEHLNTKIKVSFPEITVKEHSRILKEILDTRYNSEKQIEAEKLDQLIDIVKRNDEIIVDDYLINNNKTIVKDSPFIDEYVVKGSLIESDTFKTKRLLLDLSKKDDSFFKNFKESNQSQRLNLLINLRASKEDWSIEDENKIFNKFENSFKSKKIEL